MIVKIVAGSNDSFSELYEKDQNEYIIGVDYGCKILNDLDINIDLAIGDFDSFPVSEVSANLYHLHPFIKDYGDLEIAIIEALKLDFKKIVIYNATGGRIDHFIAALNILKKYHHKNIVLIDDINRIYVMNGIKKLNKDGYKYISFFAIEDKTTISLKGFKFDLNNYILNVNDNLCLSNKIICDATVSTNKPVLVIFSK